MVHPNYCRIESELTWKRRNWSSWSLHSRRRKIPWNDPVLLPLLVAKVSCACTYAQYRLLTQWQRSLSPRMSPASSPMLFLCHSSTRYEFSFSLRVAADLSPNIGYHAPWEGRLNFSTLTRTTYISPCTKGIATREDIDTTLKLGMNHPMGPLQLGMFALSTMSGHELTSLQPICKFPLPTFD